MVHANHRIRKVVEERPGPPLAGRQRRLRVALFGDVFDHHRPRPTRLRAPLHGDPHPSAHITVMQLHGGHLRSGGVRRQHRHLLFGRADQIEEVRTRELITGGAEHLAETRVGRHDDAVVVDEGHAHRGIGERLDEHLERFGVP